MCVWQRNHWTPLTYKSCSTDVISKMKWLYLFPFCICFLFSSTFFPFRSIVKCMWKVNDWYGYIGIFFACYDEKKTISICFFISPYHRNKFIYCSANNAPFQWINIAYRTKVGDFFFVIHWKQLSRNYFKIAVLICMRVRAHWSIYTCTHLYSSIYLYIYAVCQHNLNGNSLIIKFSSELWTTCSRVHEKCEHLAYTHRNFFCIVEY